MKALEKLAAAQIRTGSLLSVGLEPSFDYLPPDFPRDLQGCEDYLELIVEATADLVCAYKLNLAFFEAHGWEGVELMYTIRERLPDDVLVIADGKRGDVGSSAKFYAEAMFDRLEADAATVNPLMGHDAAAPFLDYTDRLTFFLVLTSNPGANDFLEGRGLADVLAETVVRWSDAENVGFVVGATRPERLKALRAKAPEVPFLVPGIGAQGGDLGAVLEAGRARHLGPGLVLHGSRALVAGFPPNVDPASLIRQRVVEWNERIARLREAQP